MKVGTLKFFIFLLIIFFQSIASSFSEDNIKSVPLINLEELSPTFEEDKDVLEKNDDLNIDLNTNVSLDQIKESKNNDKVFVNLKALDKITAKTSAFKLTVGEKKLFGPLEIVVQKCQYSENNDLTDAVAYLQVKDLSSKNNNQVFLFNGWTFASSPTLQSIDHPVYDLWITSCENI